MHGTKSKALWKSCALVGCINLGNVYPDKATIPFVQRTLLVSLKNWGRSNQWHAWLALTICTDPSLTGISSAGLTLDNGLCACFIDY